MNTTFSGPLSRCLPIHLRLWPTLAFFFSSIPCSHIPLSFYSRLRACSQAGDYASLLSLFVQISREQALKPDRPTYLLLLKASAALPSHPLGLSLHGHILKSGFQDDILVVTALVDTLCKCGDVEGARKLFDQIPERDVGAWNAMLSGYARNGCAAGSEMRGLGGPSMLMLFGSMSLLTVSWGILLLFTITRLLSFIFPRGFLIECHEEIMCRGMQ